MITTLKKYGEIITVVLAIITAAALVIGFFLAALADSVSEFDLFWEDEHYYDE